MEPVGLKGAEAVLPYQWIDRQDTLFWVRYTLWPGRTPEVIRISAEQVDPLRPPKYKGPKVPAEDRDEALFTVESGYPIDTSFVERVKLPEHQGALLRGVTFLFDGSSLAEDREAFKANYAYRLSINQKWFHEGPMRMFPLVAPLDMVTGKLPELTEPWADIWEPPNYMLGGMYMGIVLTGHPVVLKQPLDFMVAMIGHLDRPVQ